DVIYGGSVNFQEAGSVYNGFQIQGAKASQVALDFSGISNGDLIDLGKGGNNRVLFRSAFETGFTLQKSFRSFYSNDFLSLGTNATSDISVGTGLTTSNLLVGSNGQFIGANGTSADGAPSGTTFTKGVFSGAVGIDTLNNFQVGRDKIVLDSSEFSVTSESVKLFRGRGALYGVIANGSGAGLDYSEFDNVLNGSGYFYESFVRGVGSNDTFDENEIDFSEDGQLFFDLEAQGLYLGYEGHAKLIARLPGVNLTGEVGSVANDFVTTEAISNDPVTLF
ncbi:hypothetical protein, partial [Geitlerinema sp. P-1104]|uniref:hypothetical protein n=1 Tax=Geitlerinema sp. P-1104 TaxID=2546230 RepID=UPI0014775B5B